MPITLDVSVEAEEALRNRAHRHGLDIATYVRHIVEMNIRSCGTFDEVLAPIRQGFAESGLTERELDMLLEQARDAVWQEGASRREPEA
jgi:predicted DNA-binding protein